MIISKYYRPDCNRANLARDGPILQGPQAYLTTIARELALLIDHTLSFPRTQHEDYNVHVDYDMIFGALSLTPKEDHMSLITGSSDGNGGDNGTDDGNGGGTSDYDDDCGAQKVIQPLPWKNAPKPDGSTTEFQERLERCSKYMHHFATHTPYHFLKHDSGMRKRHCHASRDATTNSTKKRKAPNVDEEEGQFQI